MSFQLAPREHPKMVRGADDRLVIVVDRLPPEFAQRGTYKNRNMPDRFRYLHPDALDALVRLEADHESTFYYSDVFRNPDGSRNRRRKNRDRRIKQGKSAIYTGKLPGSSAHNFGLSVDMDVDTVLQLLRLNCDDPEFDKQDLDLLMRGYGWYCHRDGPDGDHSRGREDWHYNYLGDDPERWLAHGGQTTAGSIEAKIQYMYGPFTLDDDGIVSHLHDLGHLVTVQTSDASYAQEVRDFQRAWTLPADGIAGPQTQRVLLAVNAELRDRNGRELPDVHWPGPGKRQANA